jgi:catechol 2,3-dioxygenase-like lactoylglutathione lyase family enzyme
VVPSRQTFRGAAAVAPGRGAARAEDASLVNTCAATDTIAVAKNKEVAWIEGRVIAQCSFSRRLSPMTTPTGTRWAVSKVRLARPAPPGRVRKHISCPVLAVRVERVDFVSFLTTDIARAKRFYTELLGLEVESEGEHDIEFRAGQVTLDIFDPSSIGQPFAPSPAGLSLRVPDVLAARAELEARGVEFDGETLDTGVCHMASFRDPDGNALMLHRRYAAFEDGREP